MNDFFPIISEWYYKNYNIRKEPTYISNKDGSDPHYMMEFWYSDNDVVFYYDIFIKQFSYDCRIDGEVAYKVCNTSDEVLDVLKRVYKKI